MKVRLSVVLALIVVAGCVLFVGLCNQPSQAQVPAAPSAGRYQLSTIAPNGGSPGYIVVLDTATGRCWTRSPSGGQWQDLGSPPGAK